MLSVRPPPSSMVTTQGLAPVPDRSPPPAEQNDQGRSRDARSESCVFILESVRQETCDCVLEWR